MSDHFWATYARLAKLGQCDSPGGAEYERVRAEWIAEGKPEKVFFILRRANLGPFGDDLEALRTWLTKRVWLSC